MKSKALHVALSNIFDALTIILMILAGRLLGETDFGVLSYAQSLALVVLGIGNAGLAVITVRDVARDRGKAPEYFALILPWAMFLTLLALLGMVAALAALRPAGDLLLPVALLIGAATYFRAMVLLLRSFFRGLQRFDREALAVGLENALVIGGGAATLLLGHGLIALAVWLLFGRFLGFVINIVLLRDEFPLRLRIDAGKLAPIARAALPVGLAQFVFMTIAHVDTLLLGLLASFAEVGQFSAAFKVYWGLMLVPTMVSTLFMPALAERLGGDKADFNAYLLMGSGAALLLGLGAILIGVPLAGWGISLLYGSAYGEAVPVMRILLVACLPAFVVVFLRSYLVVIDHRRALFIFSLAGLGLRLVLDPLLIVLKGIEGAAAAVLISETLVAAAICVYLLRRHFRIEGLRDFAGKLGTATARIRSRR